MGYILTRDGFDAVLKKLGERYRLYSPTVKVGEGRFTGVDVVRYDFISSIDEIELKRKSDYAFKEIILPLSETLFYFTEDETKTADIDEREIIVFLRACDLHAVKRLDQIYLDNGQYPDWFYNRLREKLRFALIGCPASCAEGFCVSMGSNRAEDGYVFSIDDGAGKIHANVLDADMDAVFAANAEEKADVKIAYVTKNNVAVRVPETVPNAIRQSPMWDEYTSRCIGCGRCNFVCPTCTCYTMQDVYYTENGKVGERRRVAASCMVDGYTNVAGGGQYRRNNGERMRFKVLHKVYDFRKRFSYDMCVGCGRCDAVCPEYISFSNCINKLDKAVREEGEAHD